jgi:hypothetical protein
MNRSYVQLDDLPDELLMFIFNKMNNIDLLYSLFGINQRLDLILQDSNYTNCMNFFQWSPRKYVNRFSPEILSDRLSLCRIIIFKRNSKCR